MGKGNCRERLYLLATQVQSAKDKPFEEVVFRFSCVYASRRFDHEVMDRASKPESLRGVECLNPSARGEDYFPHHRLMQFS